MIGIRVEMANRRRNPDFLSRFSSKSKLTFRKRFSGDIAFKVITILIACNVFVILGLMLLEMGGASWLSIKTYGLEFLWGTTWQPVSPDPSLSPSFGALPLIWGTLVTSAIALLLGVPISLGIALALSEYAPKRFTYLVSFLVELLAAIPSVIYGLWGIFVLIPFLQNHVYPSLQATLGFLPLFQGTVRGPSVLTGGIVLAIMIIPTISAISRDAFSAVPRNQREAILALGATEWETSKVVISYARSGVIGAIVLGLGRAVGETMAITMVIGNSFNMFGSLFDPGYTLASIVANEFTEASSPPVYLSALVEVGLVLLVLALVINALARLVIWRATKIAARAETV
jgi:phosphate transport system permease protein